MDYKAMYQEKLTTAAEAVKIVKSGDWVDYGWSAVHPRVLDEALAARLQQKRDADAAKVLEKDAGIAAKL